MKFIYVLEDDERTQKDLFDTLKSIDPQLHIRFFPTLALFHEFLTFAVKEGPKALAVHGQKYTDDTSENLEPAENHELRLVIAKYEFFGKKNMGLIKRARDFFLRKKMCAAGEPTALILTAFDSPDFDISLAEERIINNVIFKPFDKLILKQHLEYALTGHHPVTTETVASFQINSTLEMLKEVSLNSVSEIGFTTLNNHDIEAGAFTKYYSDSFKTDEKRSVFAQCVSSKEVSPKEFLCEFHFFGIDNKQISQIRRNILQNKAHTTVEIKNFQTTPLKILILDEEGSIGNEFKGYLTDKMANVELYNYTHVTQLISDLADKDTPHKQVLPDTFDLVFASYDIFYAEKEKRWEQLCIPIKDRAKAKGQDPEKLPALYLISKHKIPVDETRDFVTWVKEIFYYPLDKNYITRKLLSQDPRFTNNIETPLASAKDSNPLKVANPVEITQISEAGLVLKYYREMSIGAFREFILWRRQELENPEIIGTVNFTEKDKGGGDYFLNHFVFFGMKDQFLKHIRLWLLDVHIQTKDKE